MSALDTRTPATETPEATSSRGGGISAFLSSSRIVSVLAVLAVPKFRGGRALEETIKLRLTADVSIDTSRDIA